MKGEAVEEEWAPSGTGQKPYPIERIPGKPGHSPWSLEFSLRPPRPSPAAGKAGMWQPACLSLDRLPYLSRGVRWQFALEGVREVGRRVCGAAACWPGALVIARNTQHGHPQGANQEAIRQPLRWACRGEAICVPDTAIPAESPPSFVVLENPELRPHCQRSVSPARVWPSRLTLGPPVDPSLLPCRTVPYEVRPG